MEFDDEEFAEVLEVEFVPFTSVTLPVVVLTVVELLERVSFEPVVLFTAPVSLVMLLELLPPD